MSDLSEFKRGMVGLLKVLAQESLEGQRLDHYQLYQTMQEIVEKYEVPVETFHSRASFNNIDFKELDEETTARMILSFLRKENKNDR